MIIVHFHLNHATIRLKNQRFCFITRRDCLFVSEWTTRASSRHFRFNDCGSVSCSRLNFFCCIRTIRVLKNETFVLMPRAFCLRFNFSRMRRHFFHAVISQKALRVLVWVKLDIKTVGWAKRHLNHPWNFYTVNVMCRLDKLQRHFQDCSTR